jgi:hypothetical protein
MSVRLQIVSVAPHRGHLLTVGKDHCLCFFLLCVCGSDFASWADELSLLFCSSLII